MQYFVQLNETNTTLNLGQIVSVEWNCVRDELSDTNYTTTVSLSNGSGYYITENDARTLWRALQRYNTLVGSYTSQFRNGQNGNGAAVGQSQSKVQTERPENDPAPTSPSARRGDRTIPF